MRRHGWGDAASRRRDARGRWRWCGYGWGRWASEVTAYWLGRTHRTRRRVGGGRARKRGDPLEWTACRWIYRARFGRGACRRRCARAGRRSRRRRQPSGGSRRRYYRRRRATSWLGRRGHWRWRGCHGRRQTRGWPRRRHNWGRRAANGLWRCGRWRRWSGCHRGGHGCHRTRRAGDFARVAGNGCARQWTIGACCRIDRLRLR